MINTKFEWSLFVAALVLAFACGYSLSEPSPGRRISVSSSRMMLPAAESAESTKLVETQSRLPSSATESPTTVSALQTPSDFQLNVDCETDADVCANVYGARFYNDEPRALRVLRHLCLVKHSITACEQAARSREPSDMINKANRYQQECDSDTSTYFCNYAANDYFAIGAFTDALPGLTNACLRGNPFSCSKVSYVLRNSARSENEFIEIMAQVCRNRPDDVVFQDFCDSFAPYDIESWNLTMDRPENFTSGYGTAPKRTYREWILEMSTFISD